MLKKYFIITILLLAYTIVLGHSIIPHHHHDHAIERSTHHHNDHENDDHDDEGLGHGFENYLHSGNTADFHQKPEAKITYNAVAVVFLVSYFEFKLNAIESPPDVVWPSNGDIPIVQCCLSSKGLRAPPFSLV